MTLEEEYFKKYIPDYSKLTSYGFKQINDAYIYEETILEDELKCIITISSFHVSGKVIDAFDSSEYTNFRIHRQLGEYASSVKEAYLLILEDIRNNCFKKQLFQSSQAIRLNDYITSKFNALPEVFDKDVICYRNIDHKWFALIMNVEKRKLVGDSNDTVDIINLKTDEATESLLKQVGIYTCYHMSKTKWISIILDDTLKDSIIEKLINFSYLNTHPTPKSKGEWIVPIWPDKNYIDETFIKEDSILSKQSAKIQIGDICYLYLSKPYSSICYKTRVIENNIPYNHGNSSTKYLMLLELIESYNEKEYTLELLKNYGVKTVRSARFIPSELSKYINGE